jgi:hypothetical protein
LADAVRSVVIVKILPLKNLRLVSVSTFPEKLYKCILLYKNCPR